jgi:predicted dehydrogenase
VKDAQLEGAADVSAKSLRAAKRAGVRSVFEDYRKLLKSSDIDAVIISLPTFLHEDAAVCAAENGKHILIEKPLARNVREAQNIVKAARQNGVGLMVGYQARFSPEFQRVKNEMASGGLGDIQMASASHVSTGPLFQRSSEGAPKPVPTWWFDRNLTGGGALMDLGCHMVNIFRWFFGDHTTVQSYLGHRFNLDLEDYALCVVKFQNGTLATLHVGWFARYYHSQINLYGTVRSASVRSKPRSMFNYAKRLFQADKSSPRFRELEHFVECIRSSAEPSPSGQEGVEDIRLIQEAYKNASIRQA